MNKYTGFINEFLDDYAPALKVAKSTKINHDDHVALSFRNHLENLTTIAKEGIKFKLPLDAKLFDVPESTTIEDTFVEYIGQELNLPFEKICMEFMIEYADKVQQPIIVFAQQSEQIIKIWISFKSAQNAWQTFQGLNIHVDRSNYTVNSYFDEAFDQLNDDLHSNAVFRNNVLTKMNIAVSALAQLLCALTCGNVGISDDDVKPSPVKQSMRRNKGKLPFFSYKVLTIKTNTNELLKLDGNPISDSNAGTEKGKKRAHLRRGHIRKYQSGLKIWVNSCAVGNKSNGVIDKTYNIK